MEQKFHQFNIPSLGWTYRYVLQNDNLNTFNRVVTYLEQNQVACSLYNIIGGTSRNQGVIISRDPFDMYPTISLNTSILGQTYYQYTHFYNYFYLRIKILLIFKQIIIQYNQLYLVQTNYDHWLTDPFNDQRRTIAENLLAQLQNNLWNEFGVFTVMDTFPIHNESTFYTIIMNAKYNRLIHLIIHFFQNIQYFIINSKNNFKIMLQLLDNLVLLKQFYFQNKIQIMKIFMFFFLNNSKLFIILIQQYNLS